MVLTFEGLDVKRKSLRDLPTDEAIEGDPVVACGTRVRAAPISERWNNASRFEEVFRVRWKEKEPSNVVETVMLISALTHLARSRELWGLKVVVASDNLCCIGVISKGRSSRRRMLILCRQAAALQIATGIRVLMRFVPSHRNWADGPSRGEMVGCYDQASNRIITTAEPREWGGRGR